MGTGAAGSNAFYRWADPEPIPSIMCVGLSSWDTHNCYRNIQLLAPVDVVPGSPGPDSSQLPMAPVPSLVELCSECIREQLSIGSVCSILEVCEIIAPSLDGVRKEAISFLAENLPAVKDADPEGLAGLALSCIMDLLRSSQLVSHLTRFSLGLCFCPSSEGVGVGGGERGGGTV